MVLIVLFLVNNVFTNEIFISISYFYFRYVGRLFVKGTGKPVEILTKLNEMAGFATDVAIELYEVSSSTVTRSSFPVTFLT